MRKEDFNIMYNVKIIEELKAELLCIIEIFLSCLPGEVM